MDGSQNVLILHVEDSPDIQELLDSVVGAATFSATVEIIAVPNETDAIDRLNCLLREGRKVVALIDQTLSPGSGDEVARECSRLCVPYARWTSEPEGTLFRTGSVAYVPKPARIADISGAVQALIGE